MNFAPLIYEYAHYKTKQSSAAEPGGKSKASTIQSTFLTSKSGIIAEKLRQSLRSITVIILPTNLKFLREKFYKTQKSESHKQFNSTIFETENSNMFTCFHFVSQNKQDLCFIHSILPTQSTHAIYLRSLFRAGLTNLDR